MASNEELSQSVQSLSRSVDAACGEMDHLRLQKAELLIALKAALPNLEWANVHGSRCEELLSQVKSAIRNAA